MCLHEKRSYWVSGRNAFINTWVSMQGATCVSQHLSGAYPWLPVLISINRGWMNNVQEVKCFVLLPCKEQGNRKAALGISSV